jgi:hypothetical protein
LNRRQALALSIAATACSLLVPPTPTSAAPDGGKVGLGDLMAQEYHQGWLDGERHGFSEGWTGGFNSGYARYLMEKSEAAVVAGALYDFMGYLTTGDRELVLSGHHEPYALMERFQEWAERRGLDIKDADVDDWHERLSGTTV